MTTSESFRQEVAGRLDALVRSSDPNAQDTFPSCLSAEERKYVHHLAEQFGLKHDSRGKGDARQITVRRDPAKAKKRGLGGGQHAGPPGLRLPSAAQDALRHPLVEHAAGEGRLEAINAGAPLFEADPKEIASLLGRAGGGGASQARAGAAEPVRGPPESSLLPVRQGLPAWGSRAAVLEAVAAQQVTLVVGETGCGKSTQVPQFLLEEGGAETSIVVTQPRRLSALALAHRVAQERGESVGATVGYSVHLENTSSSSTRLLYCTTGVFRRRFLADPLLSSTTHLVLDELHEREKVTDFLLIAIKELLTARPQLRVVLMSATMQHETFRRYFPGCAEVTIPGRSFPVEERYLEDVAATLHGAGHATALGPGFAAGGLGYGSWSDKGGEKSFKYQVLVSHTNDRDGLCGFAKNAKKPLEGSRMEEGLFLHDVLQQTKGVAYDIPIVEALLSVFAAEQPAAGAAGSDKSERSGRGGILVFLPGWDDIDRMKRRLLANKVLGDESRFLVLALHSQIQLEQQREVFKAPPPGVRKIILSTNIAETSLTIDDVDVVVDCGRSKETSYDAFLRAPTLNTSWVSRASSAQRAGRAGRTAPGTCYHLFSRQRLELLDAHRPPEMLRTALDDVCLHTRLLLARQDRPDVAVLEFLSAAPDPPGERSVLSAEALLQEIGALTARADGPGQLTALGVHLSALPLTPQLAKAAIWANILGVGDSMLAIASGLQYREPFVGIADGARPISMAEANKTIRRAKSALCSPACSDHIALLRAIQGFEKAKSSGAEAARQFCVANSLSHRQMQTLLQTCGKLRGEMRSRGLASEGCDRHGDDTALLTAALCAGLFPNVAQRPPKARQKLRVCGGRLEAVPHPSSVAGGQRGEAEPPDASPSSASQGVEDECEGGAGAGGGWLCFQELGQLEDHYSLSGLSRVPATALLLLCGEGDLLLRDAKAGAGGAAGGAAAQAAEGVGGEEAGGAVAEWWAAARATGSANGAANGKEPARPHKGEEVVLSIAELGDWFSFRLPRELALRVQALRAMLRFLFRVYCCEPSRWKEVVADGQVGALVLEVAASVVRAEAGNCEPEGGSPSRPSAPSRAASSHGGTSAQSAAQGSKVGAVAPNGIAARLSRPAKASGQAARDPPPAPKAAGQNARGPPPAPAPPRAAAGSACGPAAEQQESFYSGTASGSRSKANKMGGGMRSAAAWDHTTYGTAKGSSALPASTYYDTSAYYDGWAAEPATSSRAWTSGGKGGPVARAPPSRAADARPHPRGAADAMGSGGARQCGTCGASEAGANGATDEHGAWYCFSCWNVYYANVRADASQQAYYAQQDCSSRSTYQYPPRQNRAWGGGNYEGYY